MSNEQLIERLERLEKQNRWMKAGVLSVLLLGTVGFFMGTLPSVQPFILVPARCNDIRYAKGALRLVLGQGPVDPRGGRPSDRVLGVTYYDKDNDPRLVLGETAIDRRDARLRRPVGLTLFDRKGEARAELMLTATDSDPIFRLIGDGRKGSLEMSVDRNGPVIFFLDSDGRVQREIRAKGDRESPLSKRPRAILPKRR